MKEAAEAGASTAAVVLVLVLVLQARMVCLAGHCLLEQVQEWFQVGRRREELSAMHLPPLSLQR